jgi:hypothetical protein
MLPQSKNNGNRQLPKAISTKIASKICAAITLFILFSMGFGSYIINGASTTAETSYKHANFYFAMTLSS